MKTNIYNYLSIVPKICIYGIIILSCSSSHIVLADRNEQPNSMIPVSLQLHSNDAVDSDVFSFISNKTTYARFSDRSTAGKQFIDQSIQNSNDLLIELLNENEHFSIKPKEVLLVSNSNKRIGRVPKGATRTLLGKTFLTLGRYITYSIH